MKNYMADKEFLSKLDLDRNKEIFAQIIALDLNENPLEKIEGRITGGSVNVDGASVVRRTCSLSMVAQELNITDYYWGLKTKFKLLIGLRNNINKDYPDIIWFKMGTYVISNFSTSHSTNGYTISLQGKDKMTLLNGDMGGTIPSLTWDFGQMYEYDENGNLTIVKYKIEDIIKEVVRVFAQEPFENIIINDIAKYGLELLEYRGENPLYLIINNVTSEVNNMTTYGEQDGFYTGNGNNIKLDNIPVYDRRINLTFSDNILESPTIVYIKDNSGNIDWNTQYTIGKVEFGETAGYRRCDLVYAGDLIGNVGEPVTTACLDKIVNMLGDFEYFYDLDGRFIFQERADYVTLSWNNMNTNLEDPYIDPAAHTSAVSYYFEDGKLITSYQNSPALNNLRNDYSIWGTRKSVTGAEIPVHMRYAIDRKPKYYKNFDGVTYITQEQMDDENAITAQTFKTHSIDKLDKDWWEITDWARFYLFLLDIAGDYPVEYYLNLSNEELLESSILNEDDKIMSYYWTSFTYLDLNRLFTDNEVSWNPDRPLFLFDTVLKDGKESVVYTAHNPAASWDISQRPTGCYHTFKELVKNKTDKNYYGSYIYKPSFPLADVTSDIVQNYIATTSYKVVDWREIIYQMALDYYSNYWKDDFLIKIAQNNKKYYPKGYTGYEQYYVDLEGFWRDLYNPAVSALKEPNGQFEYYVWDESANNYSAVPSDEVTSIKTPQPGVTYYYHNVNGYEPIDMNVFTGFSPKRTYYVDGIKTPVNRVGYYEMYSWVSASTDTYPGIDCIFYLDSACTKPLNEEPIENQTYYFKKAVNVSDRMMGGTELLAFDRSKNYCISKEYIDKTGAKKEILVEYNIWNGNMEEFQIYQFINKAVKYYETPNYNIKTYWNINVAQPEMLNFWFDFLDADNGDLAKYAIPVVGDRPKAINDKDVKAIYFRDTPIVVYINSTDWETTERDSAYAYVMLPSYMENMFSISAQGKSAKDLMESWVYNYGYCTESISLSTVPVYYLEPNTRIFVNDPTSHINGEYLIKQMTIPLAYNGTMSITAVKAAESIYEQRR